MVESAVSKEEVLKEGCSQHHMESAYQVNALFQLPKVFPKVHTELE